MTDIAHVLDRRVHLLATKIRHHIDVLTAMLRPPGADPPFTTKLTEADALAFWRKHRYDDLGAEILSLWTPTQVLALDTWLSNHPDPALSGEPRIT